jgi:surface antigen
MKYLMDNSGLTGVQAAGFVGSLLTESAHTLDPSIKQHRGGNARGIGQWEGPRWVALQKFAAQRGTRWDDLDTQLAFIVKELPSHGLQRLKGTGNVHDAAKVATEDFETPKVVVDARQGKGWGPANAESQRRGDNGQPLGDAFTNETNSVNAQRKAAEAAAAAAAEAKRKAESGMTLQEGVAFMQAYKNSPESIKFIGHAGTGCDGGPLSNCVSFSMFFINKETDLNGRYAGTGNGGDVVKYFLAHNPGLQSGTEPRVNAIFSTKNGRQSCGNAKCGHTGVVLGIDKANNKIIIGEAACNSHGPQWDTAHEYPLSEFSDGSYRYAYTDGHVTGKL